MSGRWNDTEPGPVRVKICGVRTEDDVAAAIEAGADAVGVVFARHSPRAVSHDCASALAQAAGEDIEVVSLLVNPDESELDRHVGGWIQLHGDESEALAAAAAQRARVIKAVSWDPDVVRRWARCRHTERLIVDGPRGGSGEPFDHAALHEIRQELGDRLIVAGGLTPETVSDVVAMLRPWGVDVSSGVESRRGVKDHGRIAAFCQAARSV